MIEEKCEENAKQKLSATLLEQNEEFWSMFNNKGPGRTKTALPQYHRAASCSDSVAERLVLWLLITAGNNQQARSLSAERPDTTTAS